MRIKIVFAIELAIKRHATATQQLDLDAAWACLDWLPEIVVIDGCCAGAV